MSPALAFLLVIILIPLAIAIMRANELFCLKLHGGQLHVVRGRIPQALMNDIADVVRDAGATVCTIRGLSEDNRAVIEAKGEVDDNHRQRLRNVISRWPVVRIRNAPRSR